MDGQEIKAMIKSSGVCCWQVAAALGINDGNFSRRLRKPFTESEVANIKAIVERLAAEKNAAQA